MLSRFCQNASDPMPVRVWMEMKMKVAASGKRMCRNCKIVKRKGVVRVICSDPRHKQRQG